MIIGMDRSDGRDYSALVVVRDGRIETIVVGDTPQKAVQIEEILCWGDRYHLVSVAEELGEAKPST